MADVDPHRGARALAGQCMALNEFLSAGGDRETARRRLVTPSARSVPGCDWASVVARPVDRAPRSARNLCGRCAGAFHDEAFALLRASSQHLHRKLRDVSEEVGRTGVLPRALATRRPAAAAGG